jgi:hypothetical protein
MLDQWKASGKRYLCFPFVKFHPHTLNELPAWVYTYYRVEKTEDPRLQGRVKFRPHVASVGFNPDNRSPFIGDDISHFRCEWNHDKTTWFRCGRAEQIQLLALDGFSHSDRKNLSSAQR